MTTRCSPRNWHDFGLNRLATALLAIVAISACAGAARRSTLAPGTASAEDIVVRHIDAIGGRANLDRIQSIQAIGIMNERGTLHPMFTDRRRPNLLRVRMMHGGDLVFTEVYDGSRSWEGPPDKPICAPDSAASAATRRAATQFDDPLVSAAANAASMRLVGIEVINGRRLYRLDIVLRDGSRGSYFVDPQTYLLDRVRQQRSMHPGQPQLTIEYVLDDYRPVAGVLSPFRSIERDVESGEPLTVSQTQWAEANVPIEGDPYGRPPGCR